VAGAECNTFYYLVAFLSKSVKRKLMKSCSGDIKEVTKIFKIPNVLFN
jgi:hypothetical protein